MKGKCYKALRHRLGPFNAVNSRQTTALPFVRQLLLLPAVTSIRNALSFQKIMYIYACLSVSMCVCVCVVRKMETQPKELSMIVVVAGSPGK